MKWLYVVLGVMVGVSLLVVTAFSLAGVLWSRSSMRLRREILAGAVASSPRTVTALPAPVAAYLARSLPDRAQAVTWARFEQEGEFQMGEGPDGWRPFTATHTVRVRPPAFVWDARIAMAPLLTVRVRDQYRDGQGGMTARVGGLVPVVNAPPTPELARAALERYLAEAPWTPPRLLPGDGLAWSAVDDRTAVATLTDGVLSVSVTLAFDGNGDIVSAFVPDRGREVDGVFVPTPWVGRFWDHGPVEGGFRIPRQGEVAWIVDGDTVPYWRGRIVSAAFTGSG